MTLSKITVNLDDEEDGLTAELEIGVLYKKAVDDVAAELWAALNLWPAPANSAHEAFAILLEEVDELKEHVWMNQKKRIISDMRKEAIQVAAMAIRFAAEVCNEERGRR